MKPYYKNELTTIYNGNCLEVMDYLIEQGVKFDAIITDPPYGTTACKWDNVIPFDKMWERLNKLIKENGAIVLFGREPFSSYLRLSNVNIYKYDWIWEKSKATNFLFAKQMPLIAHEDIMIFYSKIPTYNPQKNKGKPYNKGKEKRDNIEAIGKIGNGNIIKNESGLRNPRSVQYFRTAEGEGKFHPTQKPIALMEYLIKTYTNQNELVLDFTSGSFTTCVASEQLNRRSIGIELEQKYCDIGIKRLNELQLKFDI